MTLFKCKISIICDSSEIFSYILPQIYTISSPNQIGVQLGRFDTNFQLKNQDYIIVNQIWLLSAVNCENFLKGSQIILLFVDPRDKNSFTTLFDRIEKYRILAPKSVINIIELNFFWHFDAIESYSYLSQPLQINYIKIDKEESDLIKKLMIQICQKIGQQYGSLDILGN